MTLVQGPWYLNDKNALFLMTLLITDFSGVVVTNLEHFSWHLPIKTSDPGHWMKE